ncbi:MAG: nucleotide exchange factor GrpE [Mesotoga sp.]|jgi:molecular chaperone GrpE|uniref:nucleotide exchange factor GrpE n=1 Tax=unclassified Mesotoga TaxID=1184398 RepID=UPI000EF1F72F|nr:MULTISPECIES: nucleotide exchange factor GrpE [unclassified Mesotoga]MDI9369287.1 nucleotide exchange factor GrpE [Thermotogota bacterium]NLT44753.1 nucleotide exchange factor GrpE [Thermotogaceae bacterium]MDD2333629.1 nucleotide exchange factor GrpE [Mesotoga sp.]MDD3680267.1 nucleotide exchange factor GrpE [Mesotoga sp.]MDD4206802.1 nucleotide exchange factor GrpE [Mesotoga sp.]
MMQDRDEKNLEEIRKEFDEKERLGENKIQESEVREESEIEGMKDAQEVSDEKPNASVEESEIDESEVLKNEIRALKEENARLRAEFINYRNALIRESEENSKRHKERTILKLIDVYDNLGRALENTEDSSEGLVSGIRLIHKSIERLMFDEGLSLIIPEIGKPFDPFSHEVEGTVSSEEVPDMAVFGVVKSGYKLNGKVLKPARVVVAVNNSSEFE